MSEPSHADRQDAERRVAPRLRTLKRAKVLFNNRFSTIDCIVRNVSRTGALLTIDTAVHLPKTFEVIIAEEPPREARLVYRREMFVGIRFLDAGVDEDQDLPMASSEGYASSPADRAETAGAATIQRIVAAPLPVGLIRHLPWVRGR